MAKRFLTFLTLGDLEHFSNYRGSVAFQNEQKWSLLVVTKSPKKRDMNGQGCHAFWVTGLRQKLLCFWKTLIDSIPEIFSVTLHCVHQIIMSSGGRLGNPSTKPNCKTHRNIVRISEKIIFWFSLITCYYIRIILGLCCPFKSRKSLEKRPQNMVIFEGDWTSVFWKMFQITEV